jgi:hypothetical protein
MSDARTAPAATRAAEPEPPASSGAETRRPIELSRGSIQLTEGMPVFGSDGAQVGVVKEVRDHDFLLDLSNQPGQLDVYVPLEYVLDTAGGRATLTVQAYEIGGMGWETPTELRRAA